MELTTYNIYDCPISYLSINELALRKYDRDDEQFKKTRIQIPRMPTVLKTTPFMMESLEACDKRILITEPEIHRYATILGHALLSENQMINKLHKYKKKMLECSTDLNQQSAMLMASGFSYKCNFYPSRIWLNTVEYVAASLPKYAHTLNLSVPDMAIGIYALGLNTAEGISKFNHKAIKEIVAQFNNIIIQKCQLNGELMNW